MLVGRPDYGGCENKLLVDNTTFSDCVVGSSSGAGGSIAIFDTSATIHDCLFEDSQGTAVLFQSSSASGDHNMSVSQPRPHRHLRLLHFIEMKENMHRVEANKKQYRYHEYRGGCCCCISIDNSKDRVISCSPVWTEISRRSTTRIYQLPFENPILTLGNISSELPRCANHQTK